MFHNQIALGNFKAEQVRSMRRVNFMVKPNERLVLVSSRITAFTHPAYQTGGLPVLFFILLDWEI